MRKIYFVVLFISVLMAGSTRVGAAENTAGDALKHRLKQTGLDSREIRRVTKGVSQSLGPGFMDLPLRDLIQFKNLPEAKLGVQPLDVPAALFLTPETKGFVFKGKADSFQGSFRTAIIPLGEGLTRAGYATYSQLFPGLQIVSSMASAAAHGLYIEPEVVEYKFRYGGMLVPKILVSLKLQVTLYQGSQKLFQDVYPVKDIKESAKSLFPTEDQHSRAASAALIAAYKLSVPEVARQAAALKSEVMQAQEQAAEAAKLACRYWHPDKGITNEDKAWLEIGKMLRDGYLDEKISSIPVKTASGVYKFTPSNLLKAFDIVSYTVDGDFKKAAETYGGALLDKLVPLVGQYKAFLDASKTAMQAVIDNWVADLELHPAYRRVSDLVNDEVVRGAKRQDPYLPSILARNPTLKMAMRAREQKMYNAWVASDAFVIDFQTGGWHARIRQKYGQQLTDRQIFNRFYYRVVEDQRAQIMMTYQRVIEDMLYDEGWRLRRTLIKSTCRSVKRADIKFTVPGKQ